MTKNSPEARASAALNAVCRAFEINPAKLEGIDLENSKSVTSAVEDSINAFRRKCHDDECLKRRLTTANIHHAVILKEVGRGSPESKAADTVITFVRNHNPQAAAANAAKPAGRGAIVVPLRTEMATR